MSAVVMGSEVAAVASCTALLKYIIKMNTWRYKKP